MGGFYVEFILKNTPCALCYLQRLAMMLIALSLILNLRVPSYKNIAAILVFSIFGICCSIRHVSLKFCGGDTLYPLIWNYSLPVWAFLVFYMSIIATCVLLALDLDRKAGELSIQVAKIGSLVIFMMSLVGVVSSLTNRGFRF